MQIDDVVLPSNGCEIEVGDTWIPVTSEVWRSWTGRRKVWGMEHHGPIFYFDKPGRDKPYEGKRICNCDKCQQFVSPGDRYN